MRYTFRPTPSARLDETGLALICGMSEDYNLSRPTGDLSSIFYEEKPIVDSSGNLLSATRLGGGVLLGYDETCLPLSLYLIPFLRAPSFRSPRVSARPADRHESLGDRAIGRSGDRREWLSRIPVPPSPCRSRRQRLRPDPRAPRAAGTPISGSEEPDEMPLLKIRRRDPNSMQLAALASASTRRRRNARVRRDAL